MINQCNCEQALSLKLTLKSVCAAVGEEKLIEYFLKEFTESSFDRTCEGEVTHAGIMSLDMDEHLHALGEAMLISGGTADAINKYREAYKSTLHKRVSEYVSDIIFEANSNV